MEKLSVKPGTKLDIRLHSDQMTVLKSSVEKKMGETTLLITKPMAGGEAIVPGKSDVMYIEYSTGSANVEFEALFDAEVKKGPRTYLQIKVTSEPVRYERRADVRIRAELEIAFRRTLNAGGKALPECIMGKTIDISSGGLAALCSMNFEIGEIVEAEIMGKNITPLPLQSEVCWIREAPRGSGFKSAVGVRFIMRNKTEITAASEMLEHIATGK